MYRKIDGTFKFNNKNYKVHKATGKGILNLCDGCDFFVNYLGCTVVYENVPNCVGSERKDETNVIFKEFKED